METIKRDFMILKSCIMISLKTTCSNRVKLNWIEYTLIHFRGWKMIFNCFSLDIVRHLWGARALSSSVAWIEMEGTSSLPFIVLKQSQNSRKCLRPLALVMSFRGFRSSAHSTAALTLQQRSEEKGTGCPCGNYFTPVQHWVPYQSLSSSSHILTLSQRKGDLPAVDMNSIHPSSSWKRMGMGLAV